MEQTIRGAGGDAAAKGTQTFGKTIGVLNLIADAPRPPRFTDLLSASDLPKGTLHRILTALIEQRLVRLDPRDQTYRLGPRLFELAHRIWANFDLRDAAGAELQRLAQQWRGTAHLAVPEGEDALVIDLAEPPQPFRLPLGVGRRLPYHATALGKAIHAYRRAGGAPAGPFQRFTPSTLADADAVGRELDLVLGRGYALDDEELETGIRCVAAPILDHTGMPMGAVSLSFPTFRAAPEQLHAAARDVIETARQIAGNAGATTVFSISTPERPRLPAEPGVRCLRSSRPSLLGECPLWDPRDGTLYALDILDPALERLDAGRQETARLDLGVMATCIVPRRSGGLAAAGKGGVYSLDPASGAMRLLAPLEEDRPFNRPNDGRCDRRGRLWVGTMAMTAAPGQGSLYRVDPDLRIERMDAGFGVSNGIAWSPDDRWMYFVDSRARTVFRYAFDCDAGRISDRRAFADFAGETGSPDGIAVDAEGFVWVAVWDGWRVVRLAPDGRVDRVVAMPVPRPTSVVFGGPDLSTLYVTSGRIRLSGERLQEAPLSGCLFAFEPGCRGLPESAFGG